MPNIMSEEGSKLLFAEEGSRFLFAEPKGVMGKLMVKPYQLCNGVNKMAQHFYQTSVDAGWWTAKDGSNLLDNPLLVSNKIALMHSELSEALEADRKNAMDSHLPHRKGIEVELADLIIRVLDLAGALKLDLDGAISEKYEYNKTREDHSAQARSGENGKAY